MNLHRSKKKLYQKKFLSKKIFNMNKYLQKEMASKKQ